MKNQQYLGHVVRNLTDANGRVTVNAESSFKPSDLPPPWEQLKEFIKMFAERENNG